MRAQLFPIADTPTGRLAIMPRPRGGDWLADELRSWRDAGLDIIVSLLDAEEIEALELTAEAALCRSCGLRFIHFPVRDREVPPENAAVSALVHELASELRAGRGVGIHCRMGIGRSACLAVCVLGELGMSIDAAWSAAQASRGLPIPDTQAQRDWVAGWYMRTRQRFEGSL